MTAELLRRAAAKIRETSGSSGGSGSPWRVTEATGQDQSTRRALGTFSLIHDDVSEVAIVRGFSSERDPVAEHIASWHPAVALAVANWLDDLADDVEAQAAEGYEIGPRHPALAVARAYLQEDS